jgi:hypothetical protein
MVKSVMVLLTVRENTDVINVNVAIGWILLLERWWVKVREKTNVT